MFHLLFLGGRKTGSLWTEHAVKSCDALCLSSQKQGHNRSSLLLSEQNKSPSLKLITVFPLSDKTKPHQQHMGITTRFFYLHPRSAKNNKAWGRGGGCWAHKGRQSSSDFKSILFQITETRDEPAASSPSSCPSFIASTYAITSSPLFLNIHLHTAEDN